MMHTMTPPENPMKYGYKKPSKNNPTPVYQRKVVRKQTRKR